MKSIALVMIVKNEKKVLGRCLESVKNYVDDIIVLDTGSSDSTIDIARSYRARLYQWEWQNDFSKARNEALKYSKCDYNLSLDADDYIIKPFEKAILLARIKVHLDLRRARLDLEKRNHQLDVAKTNLENAIKELKLKIHELSKKTITHEKLDKIIK